MQFRMFSAPDFVQLCAGAAPRQLKKPAEPLLLYVGEPFALARVQVVALDAKSGRLDQVPLIIDVDVGNPRLFDRISIVNNTTVLTPLREGALRMRIRGMCEPPPKALYLHATAIARGAVSSIAPQNSRCTARVRHHRGARIFGAQ